MNWLIDNWMVVVAIACVVALCIWYVIQYLGMPTEKQKAKVKEWLVWACIKAEKALKSGTGQAKLRQVYDAFCAVPAFTWVARIISFETFSKWTDVAVVKMKKMLISNKALAEYVYGDKAEEEVAKIKVQLEE